MAAYIWANIEDEWFREDAEKGTDLGLNFCKKRLAELQKDDKFFIRKGLREIRLLQMKNEKSKMNYLAPGTPISNSVLSDI